MKSRFLLILLLLCAVVVRAEDSKGGVHKDKTDILKKEIQDIDFKAVPLEKAISFLNSKRGTNIKYSLVSEYKQKFPKSPEITIHKEIMSLGELLKEMLSQSPGFTMLNKRNNIVILPRDWEEKDAFLTMKVSMVKKDVIISDIIDSIRKEYFIKYPHAPVPPGKKTEMRFGGGKHKDIKKIRINLMISNTRVIDVLIFLGEIDDRFGWFINKGRGFSFSIRPHKIDKKANDKKSE